MKYKAIKRFRDKYTREIILPGANFECDDPERIANLLNRGLIKEVKDQPVNDKKNNKKTAKAVMICSTF